MKLTATLKVSITIKNNESLSEATERVLKSLIDVVDDWINEEGPHPYIKVELDIPEDYIEEAKLIN
jgi:uncharacterized protein (DUF736 family)